MSRDENIASKLEKCPNCNSKRIFEFQLLPSLSIIFGKKEWLISKQSTSLKRFYSIPVAKTVTLSSSIRNKFFYFKKILRKIFMHKPVLHLERFNHAQNDGWIFVKKPSKSFLRNY
ncbi:hypothetical protein SSS_10453 [Sarcoptes scabiei]|nr:hypothetical protein SSS_10453 [Sarcoptes scabiei]